MTLTKIKLINFKSYKEAELNLSNVGLCSVVGSNGAGKSSIVEALMWCIYGTGKLPNKELVRYGTDYMSVEVWFEIDNVQYKVEREYEDEKVKLTVKVNGEEVSQGSKAAMAVLTKAIGSSRELLNESIVIPQGQLSSFIKFTPSQRRDLIASILGLDKYGEAWASSKESLKEMGIAMATANGTIATVMDQLKGIPMHKELDADIDAAKAKLVAANVTLQEFTQQYEKIMAEDRVKNETLTKMGNEIGALNTSVATTELQFDREISKIATSVKLCDQKSAEIVNLREYLPTLSERLKDYEAKSLEFGELNRKVEDYQKEMKNRRDRLLVISTEADKCPLCGNLLTAEKWQEIMGGLKGELETLMKESDVAHRAYIALNTLNIPSNLKGTANELAEAKEKIAKLEGQEDSKQILTSQLEDLKVKKEQVMGDLRGQLAMAISTTEMLKGQLSSDRDILKAKIGILTSEQSALSNRLIVLTSNKQTRENLENGLTDVENNLKLYRSKLPEIEFIAGALSPTGIPLMMTDYYLPIIENRAQELLQMMSDGQLRLKLEIVEGGTKKGVEIYAGTESLRPIQSLSGGEGTRVSLAVRLALAQILSEMSGCRFDCVWIDEPEFLDGAGIDQFIRMVNGLKGTYRQCFVMSHIEKIKDAFPNCIMLDKVDDISKARVV